MTRDECGVDPEESRPSRFKNKVFEENHLIEDCRSVQPKADQGWSWDGKMIQKSYLIATTRSEDANYINLRYYYYQSVSFCPYRDLTSLRSP
jgi:hypothetical protein